MGPAATGMQVHDLITLIGPGSNNVGGRRRDPAAERARGESRRAHRARRHARGRLRHPATATARPRFGRLARALARALAGAERRRRLVAVRAIGAGRISPRRGAREPRASGDARGAVHRLHRGRARALARAALASRRRDAAFVDTWRSRDVAGVHRGIGRRAVGASFGRSRRVAPRVLASARARGTARAAGRRPRRRHRRRRRAGRGRLLPGPGQGRCVDIGPRDGPRRGRMPRRLARGDSLARARATHTSTRQ